MSHIAWQGILLVLDAMRKRKTVGDQTKIIFCYCCLGGPFFCFKTLNSFFWGLYKFTTTSSLQGFKHTELYLLEILNTVFVHHQM